MLYILGWWIGVGSPGDKRKQQGYDDEMYELIYNIKIQGKS
jgi:hypothetical protein